MSREKSSSNHLSKHVRRERKNNEEEEYELDKTGERNLKLLSPSRCRSRYYQDLLVKSSLERVASSLQGL